MEKPKEKSNCEKIIRMKEKIVFFNIISIDIGIYTQTYTHIYRHTQTRTTIHINVKTENTHKQTDKQLFFINRQNRD